MIQKTLLVSVFMFLGGIILPAQAVQAAPVEIFVQGEEYPSFEAYRQKRFEDEKKAEVEAAQAKASVPEARSKRQKKPRFHEPVPGVDFDPAKGKTVTIGPDGSLEEKTGIDLDPAEPVEEVDPMEVDPGVEDNGTVAGIEPPLKDVVQGFEEGDSGEAFQEVSSQEDIEKDLESKRGNSERPVLILSDKNKVRVMQLQEDPEDDSADSEENSSDASPQEDAPSEDSSPESGL